jgi:L-asparaginase
MFITASYRLAASEHASPILDIRATNSAKTFVFINYYGLIFTQMNTPLPNVTIFAAGQEFLQLC